jgi:hypothetical protein
MAYMDSAVVDFHYDQDPFAGHESCSSHDCLGEDSCL